MKTCLITGADSGIGKAAAYALAKEGFRLLMPLRNLNRGERVVFDIMDKTLNSHLIMLHCDLASFDSIKGCVKRIADKQLRIDVLINNAGAFFSRFHSTADGIEATYQVNYLSRFFLVNELLAKGLIKDGARIINVNGEYHRKGRIIFPSETAPVAYSGLKAAAHAKLADLLFTYELSRRLKNRNIKVNAFDPGAVSTNIIYNDPDIKNINKAIYAVISRFMKSPREGSEPLVYLAASGDVEGITGRYYKVNKWVKSSDDSYNVALARKLWEHSEQVISDKIKITI
jgi:NAD(P)-dependent dehydrogenase (short-subunit alcohol dehydrogenase family)